MKKTTEDYVKMIRLLQKKNGTVRCIAIAEAFGVTRPTVSNIVKRLAAEFLLVCAAGYAAGREFRAGDSVADS